MNFNLIAQEKSTTNINCDSLWTIMNKLCIPVDKMTSPVKPLNEIQNEFITKIDTSNFTNTVYILIVIDTIGNVLCPRLLKGNNNEIDSIAKDYVVQLRFTPAEQRGLKIPVSVILPFYENRKKETYNMIRKNGKWVMKNN